MMECVVCGQRMDQTLPWLFDCPSCGFGASTLDAAEGRGVEGLESLRRRNFQTLCDRLSKQYELQDKRLLEVGCAEGWFLEEARKRNMRPVAIEPSPEHADMARGKGFEVIDGFFPDCANFEEPFDFIVFNDVFEHLPEPVAAIRHCENLLKPGGALVLNLPSNKGIIYRLAGLFSRLGRPSLLERLWQKGLPSPHLTYFNPVTLQQFVTRHTALEFVDGFSLDTLVADGLADRVRVSHPGLLGRFITLGLTAAVPLFRILPADITVGVFEKKSGR